MRTIDDCLKQLGLYTATDSDDWKLDKDDGDVQTYVYKMLIWVILTMREDGWNIEGYSIPLIDTLVDKHLGEYTQHPVNA